MSEASTISTPAPLLEFDLPCCKCQYNLRTISQSALCPECGTAVVSSLDFQKQWASLDFRKFFRGVLILAVFSIGALMLNTYGLLFSGSTIFLRAGAALVTVALEAFGIVGVAYLAYSKPSIHAVYRFLAIFISVLTLLIYIAAESITLGYAVLHGPGRAPHALPIIIFSMHAMSTILDLIPLALGWIFLNDFAARTGRRNLIAGTHIAFAVYAMECIYHLIIYAVLILYFLDFAGLRFSPLIFLYGTSLVSVICSALFAIYWWFAAATVGKLHHFDPPEKLVAIHVPPPG